MGVDLVAPSAAQVIVASYDPIGPLPVLLRVEVPHGWQLHPGNVLGSFNTNYQASRQELPDSECISECVIMGLIDCLWMEGVGYFKNVASSFQFLQSYQPQL